MYSFLEEICIKVYFLSIFVANEIFESFFTKRDLIRYCYFNNIYIYFFIEIGLLFWWNFCFWISISANFITVFSIFIYTFKNFIYFLIYNFPLFSFKLEFEVNSQLQKLLLIFSFYNVPLFSGISIFCNISVASLLLILLIIQR